MPGYVETFNTIMALGTIVLQAASLLLLGNLLFFRSQKNGVLLFFKKHGVVIGFIVALSSMGLSLFYSDIIGFPPCELCIVQRFFIYPQTLLFAAALWKHKKPILNWIIILAFIGMLVSIYHVYIEHGGSSTLACVTDNINAVSCSARYVYEFGFVTIPVMALTSQVFMLLLGIIVRFFHGEK